MKYNLKEPCNECPFVGKWKGWIGSHKSAQDFVDLVVADAPFPCHKTIDQTLRGHAYTEAYYSSEHCAGYALFMNRMCKLSRNPKMAAMQKRLRETCKVPVLWPPSKMVEHHNLRPPKNSEVSEK